MMDVTPIVATDRQLVIGYGDGGFTITGLRHEGSVIIFPAQTIPWPVAAFDELTLEAFSPILSQDNPPTILLLGCGKVMRPLPRDLRDALKARKIVVETMDTGAACRTYNVLLTEGRDVAAALIAV